MFFQYVFNGIAVGMAYALVAVGYSLVFGILRLINFSHGAVYAFGAHVVLLFIGLRYPIWFGILVSIFLTGILGVLIDKFALAPLRKKKSLPIASLITTIGVSYIIQNLLMIFFGSERKSFPNFFDMGGLNLANIPVTSSQLFLFVISLLLLLVLTLIVKKTRIGLAMQAVEQNTKAAHLMGINVNFVITFTFFLGGASAAIAGALMAGYYQLVYPTMGFLVGLKAFAAAVLGGIGILYGSVVGGLVVGLSESLASGYIGGTYRDAAAFVILIIILIIKPTGLFGKKGISKV
ncbi:branched-chain amino acid ABC transporter permease [Synergistales bacterium]|nr:branched-chain amino acid ABC transporter permease [Synergistales bacterium]